MILRHAYFKNCKTTILQNASSRNRGSNDFAPAGSETKESAATEHVCAAAQTRTTSNGFVFGSLLLRLSISWKSELNTAGLMIEQMYLHGLKFGAIIHSTNDRTSMNLTSSSRLANIIEHRITSVTRSTCPRYER